MKHAWKLKTPELIISIAGGAALLHNTTPARVRNTFQRDLIAAAITTDAWIFTGGTNSGVMKEVGDAFDKYRYKNSKKRVDIPCIAVPNWNYTTDVYQLSCNNPNNDMYLMKSYTNRKANNPANECDIDPNHTHFLLMDDSREKAWWRKEETYECRADLQSTLRAEIEQESANIMPTIDNLLVHLYEKTGEIFKQVKHMFNYNMMQQKIATTRIIESLNELCEMIDSTTNNADTIILRGVGDRVTDVIKTTMKKAKELKDKLSTYHDLLNKTTGGLDKQKQDILDDAVNLQT
ncbi:unnamed protein product, partial [Didymodactylos carnosus]